VIGLEDIEITPDEFRTLKESFEKTVHKLLCLADTAQELADDLRSEAESVELIQKLFL
jgi:hypothetical protein